MRNDENKFDCGDYVLVPGTDFEGEVIAWFWNPNYGNRYIVRFYVMGVTTQATFMEDQLLNGIR
jgi:hypothetical protein